MATSPDSITPKHSFNSWLYLACFNALILAGAMFSAIQLRFLLPLGHDMDATTYTVNQYMAWFRSVVGGYTIAYGLAWGLWGIGYGWITPYRQLRVLIVAVVGSLIVASSAAIDGIEQIYFLMMSILVGVSLITIPSRLRAGAYVMTTIDEDIRLLWGQRYSIVVWLRYRMVARYTQQVFGVGWVLFEPLLVSGVMTIAFVYFLGANSGDVPYISFLLSGLVVYNFFRQCLARSAWLIINEGKLIKQVYFPREILVLLIVGEEVFDAFFTFLVLVGLNAVFGIYPSVYLLLVPIPLFFLGALSVGVSFIVAWWSFIFRDIQQLVNIFLRLFFYVTVLYAGQSFGGYDFLIYLNPLIGIVQFFRDCVIYTTAPDFSDLFLSGTMSMVVLYVGYVVYKVKEDRFADFV